MVAIHGDECASALADHASERTAPAASCSFQTLRTNWVSGPPKDGQPATAKALEPSSAPLVSRPPKDGRPGMTIRAWSGNEQRRPAHNATRSGAPGQECEPRATTVGRRPSVRRERPSSYCGDLTFDMSGGAKRAKLALGCPLDGGVRRHARLQAISRRRCLNRLGSTFRWHGLLSLVAKPRVEPWGLKAVVVRTTCEQPRRRACTSAARRIALPRP